MGRRKKFLIDHRNNVAAYPAFHFHFISEIGSGIWPGLLGLTRAHIVYVVSSFIWFLFAVVV